jgi:membrane protease YdiL (CAAX protease family)
VVAAVRALVRRHPLPSFLVAAYAMSWSIAIPLALQAHGVLHTGLPLALHYLTAFGPALAAILVTRVVPTRTRSLDRARCTSVPRALPWWAAGAASPLLLFVTARWTGQMAGQPVPTWESLGHINFLPDLGPAAWAFWFLTSGCGEEFGWRGFALPRLQETRSAMRSSVLLAVGWAGWHLPAFFYLPGYSAIGLRVLPGFFLGILAGAIVLTWLYNRSGGSVLSAALWHASFNLVTASPEVGGFVPAAISALVMVWAVAIAWRYDWSTLAHRRIPRWVRSTDRSALRSAS